MANSHLSTQLIKPNYPIYNTAGNIIVQDFDLVLNVGSEVKSFKTAFLKSMKRAILDMLFSSVCVIMSEN